MRWLFLVLAASPLFSAEAKNVFELLKERRTHTKFADLLESTEGIHKAYMDNFVTVFAPSNAALADYQGNLDSSFILNHMASEFPQIGLQSVSSSISKDQLQERLTTLLQGHPPLWIRRVNGKLYVNHAEVSVVLPAETADGKKQFLYLLDSILEPLVPSTGSIADFVDIKAGDMINTTEKYRVEDFSIAKYAEQVTRLGLENFPEYFSYGKFTFFIPIDSAFESLNIGLIDREVVRSHIVPGHLIFSKPVKKISPVGSNLEMVNSLQYNKDTRELKVLIAVYEGDDGKLKVRSGTETGNRNHKRGKVIANVVKANIPVQNGVVHFIDQPLVILANSLWEAIDPENPMNQRFSRFGEYIAKMPELRAKIEAVEANGDDKKGATIFIPTNAAFDTLLKNGLESRLEEDPSILGWHFLDQIIESDDIRISKPQAPWGMFSTKVGYPEDTSRQLWFWNSDSSNPITDQRLHVDGGGVEAIVVESDIRTTNGIIHVINKVLGVPMDDVKQKVKEDPMTSKSFQLGEQEHFNLKFMDPNTNFTYFVPSDNAWENIKKKYASAYKVLFLGEFFYQTHHILERHLKVGAKLSIADIMESGGVFETMRGPPLTIVEREIDGEKALMIGSQDLEARIVRSDLECSNGYVHVVDNVIMKRRDVTLSGSWAILPSLVTIGATLLAGFSLL